MVETSKKETLAVVGAGPVGIEAALEGLARGWDVQVYEAGERVGHHVRRWRHVPLFTPWSMMRGPRGEALLREKGVEIRPDSEPVTGETFLARYLEPLVQGPPLEDKIHYGCRVENILRRRLRKTDKVADPGRGREPFRLHLVESSGKERFQVADAVLDCSGVLGQPSGMGVGGGPALGESALRGAPEHSGILRRIPDLNGEDRALFAGRRVVLLGAGHSAANALVALAELAEEEPETRVRWVWRGEDLPFQPNAEDPLPQRRTLEGRARALAESPPSWLSLYPGREIHSLHVEGAGQAARLAGRLTLVRPGGETEDVGVDVLLALTGSRPDLKIFRELQVHTCYASEGPMTLAAALLGDGSGDCLEQPVTGRDVLRTTEPGFLILGHKAYGRNPFFLLKDGYRHVVQAYELLDGGRTRVEVAGGMGD